MPENFKRYVAWDATTFEFRGFFRDNLHKDIPEPNKEYLSETPVEDKGQDTHFNPDTDTFYTPPIDMERKHNKQERDWGKAILTKTDRFFLLDTPLNRQGTRFSNLSLYRQEIRDYMKDPTLSGRPTPADNIVSLLNNLGFEV